MKCKSTFFKLAALSVMSALLALVVSGCATLSQQSSAIDPDARAILQKASETLAAAKAYRFRIQRNVPPEIAEPAGMRAGHFAKKGTWMPPS